MKIINLIADIEKRNLVLPEFQREYVWSREQAKQLMVSLMKEYPVGSLLFWKTDSPPELKNINDLPERLGTVQIILDGQQRLTTLYMLITGQIPPYYSKKDINKDCRDLYFNISNGDFQYYQASKMHGNNLWWRVIDCFISDRINPFEIAQTQDVDDKDAFKLANQFNKNINKLRQIKEMDLPEQTVPIKASIDDAIDIFDRVNSKGTKLSDADLALTHITGKWPQARRVMKMKIAEMSRMNFYFDLTFMTRALTVIVTNRALFEQIHNVPKEKLQEGWNKLSKIMDYLITILPERARIHSTEDVNTTNAFIPVVAYLSLHELRFPDDSSIKKAIHWLYAALMWSRFTAQTDQRLEHDVSLVARHRKPWLVLIKQIEDQRGRIKVKPGDLEGRGAQHPLYRMAFIIAKTQGAVDWFNGASLGVTHGTSYKIHSHHIFPSSILYKNGFDSDNHLHRKLVNEIANRAFLTADTNINISNKVPAEYFADVENKYPGALVKQFIPMNPEFWKVENYRKFLDSRRRIIACRINDFMSSLIAEPEIMHDRTVNELIQLGESATLEFKSTIQWDVVRNEINKNLRFSVLKTIAAFLNSEGGTLIIGVEDNGDVLGIDLDLSTLKKKSVDGFEQLLTDIIRDRIGVEYARFVKIRFAEIDENTICAVDVEKSPEPVFMEDSKGTMFFIRHGNTTRSLDPEEMHRYIQMNWA